MSDARQLPLDLAYRAALGRGDFLVTPANSEAVAWIDRWPAWPAPALVLAGPSGAGKSHLAAVWRNRAGAASIDGGALDDATVAALLAGPPNLVVEAAEAAAEEPLLHLYNGTAERRGSLLLVARQGPPLWGTKLPDLGSRLAALPVAAIALPDDDLIRAVLMKLLADRGIAVAPQVIEYLVLRMERSFAAAQDLVAKLDAEALARGGRVTLRLARGVLEGAGEAS